MKQVHQNVEKFIKTTIHKLCCIRMNTHDDDLVKHKNIDVHTDKSIYHIVHTHICILNGWINSSNIVAWIFLLQAYKTIENELTAYL